MLDQLSPVSPRNPNSQLSDQGKKVPQGPQLEPQVFEEGTTEIPLPSKGVFYQPPFFCAEELHVRPMDFRDEDILTTQRYIEEGTVFDKLVSAVIQDRGMTAQLLTPIDRDTILIWLRANAMGKDMTIEYTCVKPACRHKNTATWDLSAIDIPKYDPEVLEELREKGEYRIVTPLKEVVAYIKVPLIGETKDTETRLKSKAADKIEHDLFATTALTSMISGIEVDGKVIRNKKAIMDHFVKIKLPISDSRYIRHQLDKINLKYDTRKDLVCEKCKNVQEGVSLPIVHQNFLWTEPTA